jgi:hypothetical protein
VPKVLEPAAPEKDTPVAIVEIGDDARGGGTGPVRNAARNGDTAGAAVEEPILNDVEVVEAAETDAEIVMPSAVDEAAAKDIDRFYVLDTM